MPANTLSRFAVIVLVVALFSTSASAFFHFMQIEQVIGGVDGDTTAQAVQLRMRALNQIQIQFAKLWVRDATGANPVLLINFGSLVPNGGTGASMLRCR